MHEKQQHHHVCLHAELHHHGGAFVAHLLRAGADACAWRTAQHLCWERLHSGVWSHTHPVWRDAYALSTLRGVSLLGRQRGASVRRWQWLCRQVDLALLLGGPMCQEVAHQLMGQLEEQEEGWVTQQHQKSMERTQEEGLVTTGEGGSIEEGLATGERGATEETQGAEEGTERGMWVPNLCQAVVEYREEIPVGEFVERHFRAPHLPCVFRGVNQVRCAHSHGD